VRSASLAKGGTSRKRPSPHLHKVPTRSNKVSTRTFQMALVYRHFYISIWGFWLSEASLCLATNIIIAAPPLTPVNDLINIYGI
jgi:hypothetical protein